MSLFYKYIVLISAKYPPLPVFRAAWLKELVGSCFPEFSFVQAYVSSREHIGLQGSKDQCAAFIWWHLKYQT